MGMSPGRSAGGSGRARRKKKTKRGMRRAATGCSNSSDIAGAKHSPQNKIQSSGGIVDVRYLDDGTIITVPELVVPWLQAYDRISAEQGGNETKEIPL